MKEKKILKRENLYRLFVAKFYKKFRETKSFVENNNKKKRKMPKRIENPFTDFQSISRRTEQYST